MLWVIDEGENLYYVKIKVIVDVFIRENKDLDNFDSIFLNNLVF